MPRSTHRKSSQSATREAQGKSSGMRTKRIALLVFAAIAAAFGFNQFTSSAQRPERKVSQAIAANDCTFLKDPENFRNAQARHRTYVSDSTQAISNGFEPTTVTLAAPQEMPRRNYIDHIIFNTMAGAGVQSASICNDAEFLRRAALDLTGRIPSEAEVVSFLSDSDPNKRNVAVDRLVSSPEFVDKWTMFFGDLFKNTSSSINITRYRAGRDAFYNYIKSSIAANKPYNQIASEMIAATGDNFVNGEVNFILGGNVTGGPNQDIYDGYTVQTATAFLGLGSMDCLLCHDGAGHLDAINLWGSQQKRADAWGMSAFFARTARTSQTVSTNYNKFIVTEATTGEYNLNTTQGNRSARQPINGKNTVAPKYMYNNGGTLNQGEARRAALARLLTADPQFARAAVNYIWEELMVEALVSPSAAFDPARLSASAQMPAGWTPQPSNPELLETMARDFMASGYNLRYLISEIVKSTTYQLSSQYYSDWKLEYVPLYARKYARRLDSEELHDAILKATNLPASYTASVNGTNTTFVGYQMTDDAGAKVGDTIWAMQMPEPLEPRSNGGSRVFLDSFLRGDRDQKLRTNDPSILQSLNLMNNTFITNRTGQANRITGVPGTTEIPSTVRKILADTTLSNDQIVTKLYLNTLSRYPSDTEKAKLLPYFTSMGKQAATESIQWVLLNKVDFIFNY